MADIMFAGVPFANVHASVRESLHHLVTRPSFIAAKISNALSKSAI
jgi:hypothetical protein